MRVSELHHCQCQQRPAVFFPSSYSKEFLQATATWKPNIYAFISTDAHPQPLRSKISPWKVLSVFTFVRNFNSLLSTASTVASIYSTACAISNGEKIKSRCNRDKGFGIRGEKCKPVQSSTPNTAAEPGAPSQGVIPKEGASGTGGSCGIHPCRGWGQRPGQEKFAHRVGVCVPSKGHFLLPEGSCRLCCAALARPAGRRGRVNPCTLRPGFR